MSFWKQKRVFLTGHTGFKGAWLSVWLHHLGAKVTGYSLAPDTTPNVFETLNLTTLCEKNIIADIADRARLQQSIADCQPDIVIHMAAQSLVRRSYREPLATITTNVMGTVNLLEACRGVESIKAVLIVTTDKCYRNNETGQSYREDDPLGGRDMYSASKAAAEIVTHAYRESFFDAANVRVATARAGNVIGGGDYSEDRLIPDAVRAFSRGEELVIRSPKSLRPWQHVVEPLSGYLALSEAMFENKRPLSHSYNFGPDASSVVPVEQVVGQFASHWPGGKWCIETTHDGMHEAGLLALDSTLARKELGWKPTFTLAQALAHTAKGYQDISATHMIALWELAT